MDTLDYIIKKYGVDPEGKLPIEIPNAGKADLAKLLHELDFKIGVEVGVAEGKYSQKLCEANPQMKIYGVDAWKFMVIMPIILRKNLIRFIAKRKNNSRRSQTMNS